MDNGMEARVIGHFDSVAGPAGAWNHNAHYFEEMIRRAGRRNSALDLGCGSGELCRRLRTSCGSVVGIDVSPAMIEAARRSNWGLGIRYELGDAAAYLEGSLESFDCIVSSAAFHHMDEGRMLRLCKEALAPGGILLVLDLCREESALDYLFSAASVVLNPLYRLAREGRLTEDPGAKAAWAAHAADDRYKSVAEMRELGIAALGPCSVERKLFWRYLLVYEKPR